MDEDLTQRRGDAEIAEEEKEFSRSEVALRNASVPAVSLPSCVRGGRQRLPSLPLRPSGCPKPGRRSRSAWFQDKCVPKCNFGTRERGSFHAVSELGNRNRKSGRFLGGEPGPKAFFAGQVILDTQ